MTEIIEKGRRITLHFELALANDTDAIIDSTFGGNPAVCTMGDGNFPKAFESCLMGMQVGEERTFKLTPEHAFGTYKAKNIHKMERRIFKDMALEEGLLISFSDAQNNECPGVIKYFNNQYVEIDFNHPLSGRLLNFRAHILAVTHPSK